MLVEHIEIQNFRKLLSVRVELSEESTLLVGANNSGKSSAMEAMRYFLTRRGAKYFSVDDFTISHWEQLNAYAQDWVTAFRKEKEPPEARTLEDKLPTLDLWLRVDNSEIHRVRDILPTLDWSGGLLGVRLRYEPKAHDLLMGDYFDEYTRAKDLSSSTTKKRTKKKPTEGSHVLWPRDFREFLFRKGAAYFSINCYLLDPSKLQQPEHGKAIPQPLPADSEALDSNPLESLIRVDEIGAQRGLGGADDDSAQDDGERAGATKGGKKLSEQLRTYYSHHLDPSEYPEQADLDALRAIGEAQELFDKRLRVSFEGPIKELEELNYPGVADPRLKLATRLQPMDGLKHSAAVQYEAVKPSDGSERSQLTLPEHYNGLGYQNLISIVFRLMGFRDAWMKVGKAAKTSRPQSTRQGESPQPIHLVLVEEPEAHLHAQVQQVFVRKAYDVLRKHKDLEAGGPLKTQLVVSTHSSHVAHECDFDRLRYFRRIPENDSCPVPTSTVCNLSEVFGSGDATNRFVTRYLRATHCDLFFADATVIVEGATERMLVPHFVEHQFKRLYRAYLTILEISGSHAHRLQPLIEHLGLTTLIITDLDAATKEKGGKPKSSIPAVGAGQVTTNPTLKKWIPKETLIDNLLSLDSSSKARSDTPLPGYEVRVAYQTPIAINLNGSEEALLASTFEDSLVASNLQLFHDLEGAGMISKFARAIQDSKDVDSLQEALFGVVRAGDKGAFALDVLLSTDPQKLRIPDYIREGLEWLESHLYPESAPVSSPKEGRAS